MSSILVLCLTITIFLPLVTAYSVTKVNNRLFERGDATPIVVGGKGSPFLLTFNSIYFRTTIKEKLAYKQFKELKANIKGKVIPLHTFHTAKGVPVVGVSFDYFGFRGLNVAEGELPATLGEAVLGSNAAKALNSKTGGSVITDCESIYDISAEYPLKMHVSGVLEPSGTPDDNVIFTDIKTAWVIDGIGHGHENLAATSFEAEKFDKSDPNQNPDDSVLFIEASEIVYNSRLKKYNEITSENINTFHFHGDMSEFPLSALIVNPSSYKEEVVDLLAELNLTKNLQAVRPSKVVNDIMEILLDIKKILDGYAILIFLTTAAFMVLIISLQVRQRKDEMMILYRIGGGKHTVKALLGIEVLILLTISATLAFMASLAVLAAIDAYLAV